MFTRSTTVPEREIHQVLSNARRRRTLEQLRSSRGTITLRELAERIATIETGESPAPRNVRQSVYTSLHQTHLRRLDELGIVEYDENRKVVRLRERARRVSLYMEVETPFGISWAEYYRLLGVGSLFVVVAAMGDAPGFSAVDPLLWGVCFLLVYGLSSAYQLWRNRWTVLQLFRSSVHRVRR
ncbi:hypothetical protein ACFO5R_21865 [Halosolutus amylolyticus]|uniref:DUF7344 domain-containing protein n=1 Tax=Halosolutus amylolyticus TaxID=2932267 RepID=A0ABD5PW62_9EURY|nr:hypothetical protein [Halosolutus amylolyticus]